MHISTASSSQPAEPDFKDKLRGHLEVIVGPMFSGKSTELIRRLKRHEIAGHKILRLNYAEDTRYSKDAIATHDKYQ